MRKFLRSIPVLFLATTVLLGGKFEGVPTAPVKIDLYTDFQCPGCRELHMGTLQFIKNDFVKTGKAYLTYHDIALPQHPYARTAALYALAAQQIGKYDEVADILFARQREWGNNGKVDATIAEKLSPADMTKIRALIADQKIAAQFEADQSAALKENLTQTPTIVFHHKLKRYPVTDGDYTFMKRFITELLTK